MELSFRWYGKDDSISLDYISQIPKATQIVSAIYDVKVGEVWSEEKIKVLIDEIHSKNLKLKVIESVPVHEDIKMGLPSRDRYIENYKQTIRNLAKYGIKVICYNFMPVFDWTRSSLDFVNEDGSTSLIFDEYEINKLDETNLSLPGWDQSYTNSEMQELINFYKNLSHEQLWNNLEYFLKEIIPVAQEVGIKMAIHPDDPPFDIFGMPRIITNFENLERFINLVDSPSNGITLCTGSLGCVSTNDIVKMINKFGRDENKIFFAHLRNVKRFNNNSFRETAHHSDYGDLDFYEIVKAYLDYGFNYYYRPDHGRMIWGESGKPGYGLYDRALGACYVEGLKEAILKSKSLQTH